MMGQYSSGKKFLSTTALTLGLMMSGPALAMDEFTTPIGEQVVGGAATFDRPSAGTLNINQSTDRVVINWDSFDIGTKGKTEFFQPGAGSLAVNRVTGADSNPTQILGTLKSNGRVMVLDRNGILFGANAVLDVGGIVASTGDVDNAAVMRGDPVLSLSNFGDGSVVNDGTIRVADAGLAAFVAPQVANNGIIEARMGKVALAAGGESATVDLYGDGLVELTVGGAAGKALASNAGTINAEGGNVLMTTAAAKGVVDNVVNMSGVVNVSSVTQKGGKIILSAAGGAVKVSGTMDASGATGGGSIKVGGDYQGGGDIAWADTVDVTDSAVLKADATDNGNGGDIVVWSETATTSRGRFYARGGANGGNGGLVETSSVGILDVDGSYVNTLAPMGSAGYWLLDPANINIKATGVAYDPVLHGDNLSGGTADIDVATINAALTNVVLAASNSITFSTNVNIAAAGVGLTAIAGASGSDIGAVINGTSYNLTAGTGDIDILLSGGYIRTNGGDVNLLSGNTIGVNNSKIFTDGGDVMMKSGSIKINNNAAIGTVGGDVNMTAVQVVSGKKTITSGDFSTNSVSINTTGITAPGIGGIHLTQDGVAKTYFDVFNSANSTETQTQNGGAITIVAKSMSGNSTCFAAGGPGCGVTDPIALNLTVTINDWTKVYGDSDPIYLTSGYVNGTDGTYTYWSITSGTLLGGDTLTVDLARTGTENVGTYAVTPFSPTSYVISGTNAYNVTFVNGNFTITSAPLTITANSGVKTYGDTYSFTGTEFTTSGLKFSDSVNSLTLSSLGAAATAGGSAVYSITGSNAVGTGLGNYNITYAPGALTVNPAILTITANSFGKTYGDLYTFLGSEFTKSGLKNSDSVTGVTLTSAGAAATAGVNTYAITASNAVGSNLLGNYTINYLPGVLTVNKAALTITANGQMKAYDGSAYSGGNGVSYVGFVGSDDETDLGGTLAYGGTSQGAVNVGSYGIAASGLTSSNYTIGYVDGTLTVNPVALTITANGQMKAYDGSAYSGGNGVSYVGFVGSDDETDLGGTLAYGGTSQGAVNVGTYAITASGYTSGNYNIGYTDGVLSVGQAGLTVTADPKTKVFGTTDPALTYYISLGQLFGKDTFTGGLVRDPGEAVGLYDINQGTLALGQNYALAFVKADFEITPAPIAPLTQAQIALEDFYRTFEGFPGPDSSFSVTITGMPSATGAGGGNAPAGGGFDLASNLANIAPAAGGDNDNSVEGELADIEPAAGGQAPAQANCWAQAVDQATTGAVVSYSFGSSREEALDQTISCATETEL